MARQLKPSNRTAWLSLVWLLAIPILNIFYGVLNRAGDHVFNLEIMIDQWIPFTPIFIIPYIVWYPFITGMLVLLAFKNRETYFQTLFALCMGLIISYIFFAMFQSTVQRPDILNETGFIYRLVDVVYRTDQPYNCFPSIHVLTSYLILRGSRVFNKIIWTVTAFTSILIILSTVFVKQHVVADIVGGILVGELCFYIAGALVMLKRKKSMLSY